MVGLMQAGLYVKQHVYDNEDECTSSELTGARPSLSLWLEQAPWGLALYDK